MRNVFFQVHSEMESGTGWETQWDRLGDTVGQVGRPWDELRETVGQVHLDRMRAQF